MDGSLYASVSDTAVSGVLCGCLYFSGILTAHQFSDPETAGISPFSEKYGKLFSGHFSLYSDHHCHNRSGKKHTLHPDWLYTRKAFVLTGAICTLLIIGISVYGILNQWNLKTKTYDVKVDKQVEGTDSLKIVLLADIHFGYSIGEKNAELLVNAINAQKPDLVCIAGDIFDNEYEGLKNPEKTASTLRSIRSRYGVYACWGNHDLNEPILAGFTFRSANKDYDDPRMTQFLKDANIRLLNDETVLIDERFYLTGRKDPSRCRKMDDTRKSPSQLTKSLDLRRPVIFMDHQPGELDEVASSGADLDLCGHTHDGQLFPLNIITSLVWENSCGYLKKGNMHNIVTSGIGIWGPNMRTATNSEICAITVHFSSQFAS